MNVDLQTSLFEKYPKIFRQKDLSPQETCMCWGIACGDGWHDLIDGLCHCIQHYIDWKGVPQVEAVQVKSKFGGLRFYIDGGDEYVSGMIRLAEHMSYTIKENTEWEKKKACQN